jgi:hypothetical protein
VTAAAIAAALGDPMREGRQWRCRCPLHGGHSLVLADGQNGRLLVRCWGGGCDARDVLAELRRLRLTGGDRSPDASSPYDHADRRNRSGLIEIARRIWGAARSAHGSPVVRYLAGRGITIPAGQSLRWAPALRRPDSTHASAMVARIDGPNGELVGVHRTYLDRNAAGMWYRRDRASLGSVGGGAVRLAPAGETLAVSEGVETALAAMQATAQPAWAALSTSGLISLALPASVRNVIIPADHDRNGAGERAARITAQHWLAEGRRVWIAVPPEPGTDFADVLAGRAYARIGEVHGVAA